MTYKQEGGSVQCRESSGLRVGGGVRAEVVQAKWG
jgi:hypothetical protein